MSAFSNVDNIKTKASLNNEAITIKHELDDEIIEQLPDILQGHYLDVLFTISTDVIDQPTPLDVCGVHIIDFGGVVVSERLNVSGMDADALLALINEMGEALPYKSYVLTVVRLSGDSVDKIKISASGLHQMEAVNYGMNLLLSENMEEYVTEAKVSRCVAEGKVIAVETDDAVTFTLTRVEEDDTFSGNHLPYIHKFFEKPDNWSGLNTHLNERERNRLSHNGLSVSYEMADYSLVELSDVIGINIEDVSGKSIASRKGSVTADTLNSIVENLVDDIEESGFVVVIESVRNDITARSRVKRNALHKLQAVEYALVFLLGDFYCELESEDVKTVEETIKACAKNGDDIVIDINGNTHTVISVSDADYFPHDMTANLI